MQFGASRVQEPRGMHMTEPKTQGPKSRQVLVIGNPNHSEDCLKFHVRKRFRFALRTRSKERQAGRSRVRGFHS